jgi:PAS domain S-box-containing protein
MKDEEKTREQLLDELEQLRRKVARLDEQIEERDFPERAVEKCEERLESIIKVLASTDKEFDEEEVGEFVDFGAIQELMDYFQRVTKIGIAILDLKGNILVATGWQDVCTKFHRVHPEALKNCIESDLFLSRNVEQGKYILYKCKNNMWDIVTPIIAGNRHIANLYLGQFFFEDEVPDYRIFIDQAKMYGFDEREYLAALEQVPRWSRETVRNVMEFYTRFADLVSMLSYGNLKLVRLLSAQKRGEEALRESQKRYKQLLDSVTDYMYTVQVQNGRPVATVHAPGCAAVTGYTSEDYDADPHLWFRMVHEQDRDAVNEQAARVLVGEDAAPLEHRIIHRDGSIRWVRNTPVPHYDDRRELIAYDGLITTITEHKQLEEVLQESQQMLQSVLDTIPVRVFWKDLDSTFLGCNRPFALDAGLQSPEEIIGKNDFEMGWAEQAELYRADDRLVMETGKPKLGYEEPQTTPDDSIIWLRTNKVPLFDVEGRIKGVLGTYENITKSKEAEEKLRAASLYARSLIEASLDPLVTISPEGKITDVNQATEQVTGVSRERLTGDDFSNYFTEPEKARDGYQKVLGDGWVRDYPLTIRHVSGKTTDVLYNATLYRNELGEMQGVFAAARDITERKQAEQALQESSQRLKLFAYSVAHDLKSPAIGLYGLTKLLSRNYRDVLDEKGRNYCDQILKASEHIAAFVDKVNVYIATKEARLCIERMDIAEILQMLKEEFSSQLSIRRIEWLQTEAPADIKADRLSMLRVFRNFVDNSLKYGGESLSVIRTGYEESEDFHIFSFSDDGKGLKEEGSEKIFGAFQRNKTSRGVEGAGLGLSIVKEIAEQHGGRVWVEQRSKKGITFYISISKNL